MKSDILKKIKIEVDGEERAEIISFPEYSLADSNVEDVPSFSKTVPVGSGTVKIPVLTGVVAKVQRDSDTEKYYYDWFRKNQIKDVVVIKTDQDGVELSRDLLSNVEITNYTPSAFDATSPAVFQITLDMAPEDIQPQ
jgi:hypothetical protein